TSPQEYCGRCPQARGRGYVAPGAATFPRARASFGTVAVQDKTGTDHTGPGPALASRPPAGTMRMPGCRHAPPQALRALWLSASLHQERGVGSKRAGYARVSPAET